MFLDFIRYFVNIFYFDFNGELVVLRLEKFNKVLVYFLECFFFSFML